MAIYQAVVAVVFCSTMAPISKGTLVSVQPQSRRGRADSEGGIGTIAKKKRKKDDGAIFTQDSAASGESLFDVRYTLDGRFSPDVERDRISIAMLGTTARRQIFDEEDDIQPSLLSRIATNRKHRAAAAAAASVAHLTKYSTAWLLSATSIIDSRTKEQKHIAALKHKKKYESKGWLRYLEFKLDPDSAPKNFRSVDSKPKLQLTDKEKEKAMKLLIAAKPHDSAVPLVAYAWGVDRKSVGEWRKKMLESSNTKVERKQRKDAGKTLINSEKKRRSVYTPRFVFAKLLRKQHPDSLFSKAEIDQAWAEADDSTKKECRDQANEWLQQGPFLVEELHKALQSTGGSVSWTTLATLVSGSGNLEMIGETAIREFVMSLPDSSYKSTRILPKLDRANKQRRYWWAHQFWIFWQSAVTFNGIQIILAHMDEKWFWSIVIRRNLKSVPFFGIEPVQHGVQHKSHLEKIMGIASTAFAPEGNDITKGGRAFLVSLVRVGRMVEAPRDTYKRVYREDGTYHYPKIARNQLRRKGELYFKGMEITGSSKGTTTKPKFDLLSFFQNTEIPRLEELAAQVSTTTAKRVIVRYQMDGAGPHTDKVLLEFLNASFGARSWHLKFQPSNSPVTNVKDDCLFPALSKHVSREQGVSKGSQIFAPDELWAAVTKCWNEFPLDTLARAYIRHSQVASAIAEYKGGDGFVRERGGLHCHVRNCCVTVCNETGNPIGVEVVSSYDADPDQGGATDRHKLRYSKPNLEPTLNENLKRMTQSELQCVFEGLSTDHQWFDAVVEAYTAFDPEADHHE